MQTSSSPQNSDDHAIENAERVIERFGGIRPMATKMGVPVTTVQGWKKRNVIPGNRRADVVNAAAAHDVDVADILDQSGDAQDEKSDFVDAPSAAPTQKHSPDRSTAPQFGAEQDLEKFKRQAMRSTMISSASLVLVFVLISGVLITVGKQKLDQANARVARLEQNVEAVQYTDPDTSAKIAKDLSQRIADLKAQADGLKNNVTQLKDQAEGIAQQIKAADVAGLMQRLYV